MKPSKHNENGVSLHNSLAALEMLPYLIISIGSFAFGCVLVAFVFLIPELDFSLLHALPAFALSFFSFVFVRWMWNAHHSDDETPKNDASPVDAKGSASSDDDKGWRRPRS